MDQSSRPSFIAWLLEATCWLVNGIARLSQKQGRPSQVISQTAGGKWMCAYVFPLKNNIHIQIYTKIPGPPKYEALFGRTGRTPAGPALHFSDRKIQLHNFLQKSTTYAYFLGD